MHASRLVRRRPQASTPDLCTAFCSLYIAARGLSNTVAHRADGGSNDATPNPMHSAPPGTTQRSQNQAQTTATETQQARRKAPMQMNASRKTPDVYKKTPEQRAAEAAKTAKEAWTKQQEKAQRNNQRGGLAKDSIFAEDDLPVPAGDQYDPAVDENIVREDRALTKRSPLNMAARLDPNPVARARWARMMVIRSIRKRGRLTREMRIARTERQHLAKSSFFKTSMKKLAPLARQIAGKTLDEAILQMRFSTKKAAKDVHKHLLQARNEAIVVRGMGLPDPNAPKVQFIKTEFTPNMTTKELVEAAMQERVSITQTGPDEVAQVNKGPKTPLDEDAYKYDTSDTTIAQRTQSSPADQNTPEITDASNTPALLTQTAAKTLKKGIQKNPTDIYIEQAWVNRGPYGQLAMPRARGRQDVQRPPYTGISVVLKEEKTRVREKTEKEIKAIRKRLNGKMWTQMPDRPVTRQSQYVLW